MNERDQWASLLAEAATERSSQPRRICELCVEMLGVTGAGLSMSTGSGNRGVVCATDEVSGQIEDLQLTLAEGPSVDAVRTGSPVIVADLDEPGDLAVERWPAFMKCAHEVGVRAVFAFPLRVGAITVGALHLYRDHAGDLDDGQLSAALMAADAGALALLYLARGPQGAFSDDLESRATYQLQVHQATGMVQVQLGITTEEAFLTLRARAFSEGRSVAEVGTDVVERRLRFSVEDQ